MHLRPLGQLTPFFSAPAPPCRQGVARHLLDACEELCAAREFRHIYLHVRLGDDPAQELYESSGYEHVDKDSFLVKLRNIMPRGLMRKAVPAHRSGGH